MEDQVYHQEMEGKKVLAIKINLVLVKRKNSLKKTVLENLVLEINQSHSFLQIIQNTLEENRQEVL